MTIETLLEFATKTLSNRFESEILLAFVLKEDRTHLYTWPKKEVSPEQEAQFNSMIARRVKGEPIAYLVGEKEFWSLPLTVSPAVLIPRPETEILIEAVLKKFPKTPSIRVLDLGTGSGAIALALAAERPQWEIIATDISQEALDLAKHNAKRLNIQNVKFYWGDWFEAIRFFDKPNNSFDLIVSNPPYIAEQDPHLKVGGLEYEPQIALLGGKQGLTALQTIISESPNYLNPLAWLMVEHGYDQQNGVRDLMQSNKFTEISCIMDQFGKCRVTIGSHP